MERCGYRRVGDDFFFASRRRHTRFDCDWSSDVCSSDLPTSGDTRYLGTSDFGRAPTNAYMRQIAVTAEELGYDGLLIPTGSSCLDPWVVASSLVPVTQRIKLLVALRTSLGAPVSSARQAATLDQALGGRLLLNVVPGGDATELEADGIFLAHDERYAYADE